MKTIPVILTLMFCLNHGFSQKIIFDPSDWQDPGIFEKNQTRPHAEMVPFNSSEQALSMDHGTSPFFLSLDGSWKFLVVEHLRMVPEGFWKPGFDVGNWDNIIVPSHWEMEGYEHPKFRNIAMTIETDPPSVPDYYNPTGCYKRTFSLPAEWNNREVMLRFEGVKSASYVWINGQPAGYNQGGFEPAEYNITPFLKPGGNDIAVKVLRFSDGAFLENQDMWRLSGIFRSVNLIAKPEVHLHDYYVATLFDENYRDAEMLVETYIHNMTGSDKRDYVVGIKLLDSDHEPVAGTLVSQSPAILESGEISRVMFSVPVKNPLQWSAEKPNLYTLVMTLRDGDGKIQEVVAKKMGFRQTEIRDGAIYVNGAMVKFNGVNSHMHHPEYGQAVPAETMLEDLLIMKQFNINVVRTSHYPPSREYLDLADELGMYIVTDAGNECHDNIWLSEEPDWKAQFVDRAVKMVYRDRNHPSVVFWSAGNEAGSGENIVAMIEAGKEIDPHRPVWMYGGNTPWLDFKNLLGPRYMEPLGIKHLAEDKILDPSDRRPSFMDEYLAATGNGLGGLDEYWEFIWRYPRLTGGAIWDWVSPGVKMPVILTPDASPLKNDPAVMGRPTFVEGNSGRAIRFSGHDDWVEFYRHPDLDLNGNELTIEFRVKPEENIQPNTFITKGSHQFGILQPNSGELEFYVHTNRRYSVRTAVPAGWYRNWHHVAGVYNGSELELYINYEKAGGINVMGNIQKTPYQLCIGRDAELHDQGEFSGRLSVCTIDEVRVYNTAIPVATLRSQTRAEADRKSVASLSFEETRQDGDFYSMGLGGRTYGIVWPDRAIQPEIHQVKKSAQPLLIEAEDIKKGIFRITNRHHFTDLSELRADWEVLSGGKVTAQGSFSVDCTPGNITLVELPLPWNSSNTEDEQLVTISFSLKEDKPWAGAGHEIAWEQFQLPFGAFDAKAPVAGARLAESAAAATTAASSTPAAAIPASNAPAATTVASTAPASASPASTSTTMAASAYKSASPVAVEETAGAIVISGEDFRYVIDAVTGSFNTMNYRDTELLHRPGFDLTVWRVPIANDMDPWGSWKFTTSLLYTPGLGRSIDNQLRTLGFDNLEPAVYKVSAENTDAGEALVTLVIFATGSGINDGFEEHREYVISGDGTIRLNHKIIPHGSMPKLLPKLGMQLFLPADFKNIQWYGRGPFETYPDRKTGAKVGLWSSTAGNEYVPYIIPQDHGNKTDTRWLRISNDDNVGLMISGRELINFSVHEYSTENLTRAVHQYQLEKAGYVTLNVDYEVTGVGGTAIRTLTKYNVLPTVREYSLTMKPFRE